MKAFEKKEAMSTNRGARPNEISLRPEVGEGRRKWALCRDVSPVGPQRLDEASVHVVRAIFGGLSMTELDSAVLEWVDIAVPMWNGISCKANTIEKL